MTSTSVKNARPATHSQTPRWCVANSPDAKVEGDRPVPGEGGGDVLGHDHPGQGHLAGYLGSYFRSIVHSAETNRHGGSTLPSWCVMIDLWTATTWNGSANYIVSRRVALGYLNRTDLANSLQFTVRTLTDIEHGVRKASPGTYAMLENKRAWARAASTPSSHPPDQRRRVGTRLTRRRSATTTPPTRTPASPPGWTKPESHPAFHADQLLVAEHGRDLLRHHRPPSHPPRHLHRRRRTRDRDPHLHRQLQRRATPFSWTKTAEELLGKIKRKSINNTRH